MRGIPFYGRALLLALFVAIANGAYAQAADPCPIPYTVGDQVKGGQVALSFSNDALAKLSKVPNLTATAGAEVIKQAYAGINSQAMQAVLEAYACKIKEYLKANGNDADKMAQVDTAVALLEMEMGLIDSAYAAGPDEVQKVMLRYAASSKRAPGSPVLDAAIAQVALKDVDPTRLFLSKTTFDFWTGVNVGAVAKVQACGGVIKAAISDGGSSLQRSLANVKAILINFLDPARAPSVGLASLFLNVGASPGVKADTVVGASFKQCAQAITQQSAGSATTAPAPSSSARVPLA